MYAYCVFTCGDEEFRVNWTQYIKYEEDERLVGVYTFSVCPTDDSYESHSVYSAAGIHHPGRYAANDALLVLDERSREFGAGWFEYTDDGGLVYYCALRFALDSGCFGIRFNTDGEIIGIAVDIYRASYNEVKEGIHGFDDTRSEKKDESND